MPLAARRSTSLRCTLFAIVLVIAAAGAGCSASYRAQLGRGERYQQQHAEQLLARALELQPGRTRAALVLAEIYNHQENVEAARAVLRRAAAGDPQTPLPWLALGRLEEQEGDVAAAEQAYRKARGL